MATARSGDTAWALSETMRDMDVVIVGGHGQIGMRLGRLLAADGDRVRGLIRNPAQADDLRAAGIAPVVCDLEAGDDVADAIAGADAVVFAAGAGPGSGAARKLTMDRDGAIALVDAALRTGVRRYVMVSAQGIRLGADRDDDFGVYLRAKGDADAALAASGLDHTIVRPGGLSDDPGTGRIVVGETLPYGGISRDDVAATLRAVLRADNTSGLTFELNSGDTPIAEALAAL